MNKRRDKLHRVRFLSAMLTLGLGVLAWTLGTALPVQAASSGNMGIRTHILNPPNAITDLSAAPVGAQNGDVQLTWTAPSNDNAIAINHYLVRFATFPAPSQPQAENWWTNASASQQLISPAFSPGTQEFTTIQSLTVGVTYYFGIKSVDEDSMVSPVDLLVGLVNQAQSQPVSGGAAPPTPTNFVGVALSTTQIRWTWNAAPTASSYTLRASPSNALVTQTTGLTITESGLTPNAALSRTLTSESVNGTSVFWNVIFVV